MTDEAAGGRVFFSSTGRSLVDEDEIVVLSVGVDIGSSTSHLVFSRIVLERLDSRYVVTDARDLLPVRHPAHALFAQARTIDADELGAFIEQQYQDAKVDPDEIDTGALILTGVAVRRQQRPRDRRIVRRARPARWSRSSAGDNLETVMAAYGSGAVARSIRDNADRDECRHRRRHLQDRGLRRRQSDRPHRGRCRRAARLPRRRRPHRAHRGSRPPLRRRARHQARDRRDAVAREHARALAARMADRLFEAMQGGAPSRRHGAVAGSIRSHRAARSPSVTFSGGVSEYIYGRESADLRRSRRAAGEGNPRARRSAGARRIERSNEGIRATVVGASQYTTQVSGSTIFVSPMETLPLRNVPVIAPTCRSTTRDRSRRGRGGDQGRAASGSISATATARSRCSCPGAARRRSSGSMRFCKGAVDGLSDVLANGHPIVLAGDGDVGGLIGIHLREEMKLDERRSSRSTGSS